MSVAIPKGKMLPEFEFDNRSEIPDGELFIHAFCDLQSLFQSNRVKRQMPHVRTDKVDFA